MKLSVKISLLMTFCFVFGMGLLSFYTLTSEKKHLLEMGYSKTEYVNRTVLSSLVEMMFLTSHSKPDLIHKFLETMRDNIEKTKHFSEKHEPKQEILEFRLIHHPNITDTFKDRDTAKEYRIRPDEYPRDEMEREGLRGKIVHGIILFFQNTEHRTQRAEQIMNYELRITNENSNNISTRLNNHQQLTTNNHRTHTRKIRAIKYVHPIKIEKRCLPCHKAQVGTTIAAFSSVVSLEGIFYILRKRIVNLLLIAGIIFLLSLFMTLLFMRKTVTAPLSYLSNTICIIDQEKDLSRRLEIVSKDEIGILSKSFNKMIEDLSIALVSRDFVENIFNSMIDTLIVTDAEGRIKVVNQSLLDLLGYEENELIGQYAGMLFAEEEEEEEEEALFKGTRLEKLLREGYIRNYDMTYRAKSGISIPVIFSGSVMKDKENKIIGIVGIAKDITERKQMEVRLNLAVRNWEDTFNAIEDSVTIIDNDNNIIFANATMHKMFKGLGGGIGMKCYTVFHKKDTPIDCCPVKLACETGKPTHLELQEPSLNNHWFDVFAYPIFGEDGQFKQTVHIVRDINERKQAEEKIKTSLKEQETLLREIHHRVKNNLQVISSYLSLQAEYSAEKGVVELAGRGQNFVNAMALIHEQLYRERTSDASKIDFRQYLENLIYHLFSLHRISDNITRSMDVNNIFLDFDTATHCGLIFNELISNSLKHAFPQNRKGEIHISFRRGTKFCAPTEDENTKDTCSVQASACDIQSSRFDATEPFNAENTKFTLIVADNGIGLPKDFNITNTKSWGMRIVNIFTKQVGGKLEVCSNDKKTEFKITFFAVT